MVNPHDMPPNGAGGAAGTHEGHASPVPPTTQGLGMVGANDQGMGNRAAQECYDVDGAVPMLASGNMVAPVNQ